MYKLYIILYLYVHICIICICVCVCIFIKGGDLVLHVYSCVLRPHAQHLAHIKCTININGMIGFTGSLI